MTDHEETAKPEAAVGKASHPGGERPGEAEATTSGAWMVIGASLLRGTKALASLFLRRPEEEEEAGKSKALHASPSAAGQAAMKTPAGATPVEDLPSTGREADRNLDRENGVNLERRERWGTALAGFAALAGVAGGVGFVVTFWTGGSNEWLGGSAAVFLGGFGLAMVLWAHWLTAHKEAVEPRERVSSPLPEQKAAAREFLSGASDIRRRRLLQWMGAAGMGALGAIFISLIRSLGSPPSLALDTDVWKRGQRLMTVDGVPIGVDSLAPGGMIIAFPENAIGSEKTQTVLVRVRQDLLQLPAQRSDWAPGGNLAYSRICTHAGCSVGMYEANTHMLMCPCHQSTFNVLTGAQPTGGPAARALPQLPLYVDSNGHLRAAGGFSDYPGPGFWGMPS
ncbi:MAG: Rieske 2Fe-2S domain-containing protein [Acidobacteriaceae bacterium]